MAGWPPPPTLDGPADGDRGAVPPGRRGGV